MKKIEFQMFGLVAVSMLFSSCANHPLRVRNDDPTLRVALVGVNLSVDAYSRLQDALFKSRKYILVDRGAGQLAAKSEQDEQHSGTESKRYAKEERYARMGRMYGVGSLIVASESCTQYQSFLGNPYWNCFQNLSLVNVTTGEVVAMGEAQNSSGSMQESPSWEDAVDHLNDTVPTRMIASDNPDLMTEYGSTLVKYRKAISTEQQNDKDNDTAVK